VTALDRKLRRDLRESGGLMLSIAGIITVGVAIFVAMRSVYANLTDAKQRYYAQCRMADFTLELKKAPLADLAPVAQIPGVTEIHPRLQFSVTVDLERVPAPVNGLAVSLPEERRAVINDVVVMRGTYFTGRRPEEVLVNDAFARQHGLHPGDRLHFLLNNRRQELFVVGTAVSSEFLYALGPGNFIPDPEHFSVFYLQQSYLEDVFDFHGACNQVLGLLAPDVRERPDEILGQAERLLAPFGVFTTVPRNDQPSDRFLTDKIRGLRVFSLVIPAIFLAVAALVLTILMRRLTEQQRTLIGTLKALGYPDRRVLAHYLRFGVVVGLAGGLAGGGLGYWLSGLVTGVYRQFFEFPDLSARFHPAVSVLGLVISLAAGVLGAARGARAVLRLEPARAMRPKPPRQGKPILLERFDWFWRRLDTGWRQALRNVARNGGRTLVGIFAAAMGTMLLVAGLLAYRSLFYMVDFQFHKVARSDVDLTFRQEHGLAALREVRRLPGVDVAEPILGVACTFRHGPHRKRGAITGLSPEARLTVPRDADGRPIRIPSAGLALGRQLAEILDVRPGEELTIEPVDGDREPRPVRVVALIDGYLGLTTYAEIGFLSRLVHEESAVSGAQLQTDANPERARALYKELKGLPGLQAVTARAEVVRNLMTTVVNANAAATAVLVLFAGLIFLGATVNSSLISLAERQQEVATLLVLGYRPRAVGGLFLRESLVVNLFGTLLGLPIGYVLFRMVVILNSTELVRLPVISPGAVWLQALGLSVVFTGIAHAIVQRAIGRMDVLERLKTYE
jgi:putative ABC transport system permease protein